MRFEGDAWSTATMHSQGNNRLFWTTAIGLSQVLACHGALAGPPPPVAQNQPSHYEHMEAHLDLRAPEHAFTSMETEANFPSAVIHRQIGSEDSVQLPSLGAGNPRLRSSMAELARNFQHEGLPLARLWENKSTLLHIGLNQRGKPGLWLVQKVQ